MSLAVEQITCYLIGLLPTLRTWPFKLELIDATSRCHVLRQRSSLTVDTWIGQWVSLVPLAVSSGVTTGGLQYALDQATLSPGSTLGLSNVADAQSVSVDINDGTLLVMVNT